MELEDVTVSGVIVAVAVLSLLVILLFLSLCHVKKRQLFDRDTLASWSSHKLRFAGNFFANVDKIKEADKLPEEWKSFKSIPYVHVKTPSPNSGECMIILYGATSGLEICHKDYKRIATDHHVDVLCLEYPGFGLRKSEKLTEDALMIDYPQEVVAWIVQHLQIPWSKVLLWGQCLGAPISLRVAYYQQLKYPNEPMKYMFLAKPWCSLHTSLSGVFRGSFPRTILPNLFHVDDEAIESLQIPVICVQGGVDTVSRVENTRKFLKRMKNVPLVRFYIVPGAGHFIPTDLMLRQIRDYSADEVYHTIT